MPTHTVHAQIFHAGPGLRALLQSNLPLRPYPRDGACNASALVRLAGSHGLCRQSTEYVCVKSLTPPVFTVTHRLASSLRCARRGQATCCGGACRCGTNGLCVDRDVLLQNYIIVPKVKSPSSQLCSRRVPVLWRTAQTPPQKPRML